MGQQNWIELPNGDKFPGEASGMIHEWVEFICSLMLLYRDEVPNIAAAIRVLGDRAQEQYPELESGGTVTLHLSQTGHLLDNLAFEFSDRLIGITGGVLLLSIDGPKVGADLLADQIDFLANAVWNEGGEDGNDGDT
jgi:hypothetical protein